VFGLVLPLARTRPGFIFARFHFLPSLPGFRGRDFLSAGGRARSLPLIFFASVPACGSFGAEIFVVVMILAGGVRDVIPTPDLRIGIGSSDRPDPRRALIGGACR
jgi:hypothetical protein